MSEIGQILGANIRQVRRIRNLTMDQLADIIQDHYGITLSSALIGAWERGERRISADYLFMVGQALGCSMHTLFGIQSDVRVQAGILSEHEKTIVEYLFNSWSGDTHALIQFMGMYMAADRKTRFEMITSCMEIYMNAVRNGMRTNVSYDIKTAFIKQKCSKLTD